MQAKQANADKKNNPPLNLREVRARMILAGTSLGAWSDRHGYARGFVLQAVSGVRDGPAARRIRAHVRSELNL